MTASVVVVAWFLEMHRNDQSKTPGVLLLTIVFGILQSVTAVVQA